MWERVAGPVGVTSHSCCAATAFFEPDASTGGAPADPASLILARTFSSSLGDVKNATLPAVHAMLDSSVQSCTQGLTAYGDIAPKVKGRKDLMLEADAYKSKVDQLRAAPPKNDPDKLPRNEEKLAKACADLAKANNELIEKLVAMERAKPALLAKDLRNIVDASPALPAGRGAPGERDGQNGGGHRPHTLKGQASRRRRTAGRAASCRLVRGGGHPLRQLHTRCCPPSRPPCAAARRAACRPPCAGPGLRDGGLQPVRLACLCCCAGSAQGARV